MLWIIVGMRLADHPTGGTWTCSECETSGHRAAHVCRDCGAVICVECRREGTHRIPAGVNAGGWCQPWKQIAPTPEPNEGQPEQASAAAAQEVRAEIRILARTIAALADEPERRR